MNLYKTAAIVTIFAAFEHALGFLYRIILSRTLGPEGLGVYQVALSVFAVFLTVSSSGLPITLSRVISKHRARGYEDGVHRATTAAIILTLGFSLTLTVLLFVLRTPFSKIFSDPRCADLFYILIFGLSFTSVYAIIRGSVWGNKRFFAYSLIELIEEIVMICVGVFLLVFVRTGLADVNKAAVAVLISYLCSFSLAVVYFMIKGGKLRSPKGELKPLLRSAMPVTAMRTSSSLVNSLISVIFPMRLMAAGLSSSRAMSAYGIVGGMVMPVLTIPCSLISSIALVLVPELSECYYKGQREKLAELVKKALNATLLIAGAIIPFLIACGEGIGVLLYSNAESGKLIARSALILIPMSVTMISTSILNSLNCERQTLLFFLLGAAAMLVCAWVLPPYLGSGALLVGMAADYCVSSLCSLILLGKKTGKLRSGRHFVLLSLVILVASIAGMGIRSLLMIYLDYVLALTITTLVIGLIEAACFHFLKLFDFKALFKKFFGKRKMAGHSDSRKQAASNCGEARKTRNARHFAGSVHRRT